MLIFLFIFPQYYFFADQMYQQTTARCITRSKVVTTNGRRPSAGTIVNRALMRPITA